MTQKDVRAMTQSLKDSIEAWHKQVHDFALQVREEVIIPVCLAMNLDFVVEHDIVEDNTYWRYFFRQGRGRHSVRLFDVRSADFHGVHGLDDVFELLRITALDGRPLGSLVKSVYVKSQRKRMESAASLDSSSNYARMEARMVRLGVFEED